MGDGMLAEFASVVDAVECAVAVQRSMVEREADLPEGERIRHHNGINFGDVVIDGDDIYGDASTAPTSWKPSPPSTGDWPRSGRTAPIRSSRPI